MSFELSKSGWLAAVVTAVTTISLASASWAAGAPRAHDKGFFLRLSGGGSAASSSVSDTTGDLKLSGLGGDWNFAVGAIVSNNLALHGSFFGWSVSDPDAEVNGTEFPTSGTISMSAFGGGVTYYTPSNFYLSPSIGIATLSADGPGGSGESDTGMALDLAVGKEWWVGSSWGLGLAGAIGYHTIPDGLIDENWSDVTFGIRFSATMN